MHILQQGHLLGAGFHADTTPGFLTAILPQVHHSCVVIHFDTMSWSRHYAQQRAHLFCGVDRYDTNALCQRGVLPQGRQYDVVAAVH